MRRGRAIEPIPQGEKNMANGSGSNLGFEERLWSAADKLRGTMDASEYKHVVLGLIFLKYISFADPPISRETRVAKSQTSIFRTLTQKEKEFIEFVLSQYIESGVEELAVEKLPDLLKIKYFTINDAIRMLGDVRMIRELFIGFQRELYGVGRG